MNIGLAACPGISSWSTHEAQRASGEDNRTASGEPDLLPQSQRNAAMSRATQDVGGVVDGLPRIPVSDQERRPMAVEVPFRPACPPVYLSRT